MKSKTLFALSVCLYVLLIIVIECPIEQMFHLLIPLCQVALSQMFDKIEIAPQTPLDITWPVVPPPTVAARMGPAAGLAALLVLTAAALGEYVPGTERYYVDLDEGQRRRREMTNQNFQCQELLICHYADWFS